MLQMGFSFNNILIFQDFLLREINEVIQIVLDLGVANMLLTVLVISFSLHFSSACRQSYVTICDNWDDFLAIKDTAHLIEVKIGGENTTFPVSVNLQADLKFNKYNKLTSLTVINAIDTLGRENKKCSYEKFLDSVIFYGNVFPNIKNGHFPKFKAKRLSLANNRIETIEKHVFEQYEVVSFDLSDNLLEAVEIGSLPLTSATKSITVKNNKITRIEVGSLPANLETLILDNNKLSDLHQDLFTNLRQLKELSLSHNNLASIPAIEFLRNLVVFDISYNHISNLINQNSFKRMDNLKLLDLSSNYLSDPYIFDRIKTPGRVPIIISLALNKIKYLHLEGVYLDKQELVLFGNPFGCKDYFEMKKKLERHESACDRQLGEENLPFCIGYQSEAEVERFQNVLMNSSKSCVLGQDSYLLLNPIDWRCVK